MKVKEFLKEDYGIQVKERFFIQVDDLEGINERLSEEVVEIKGEKGYIKDDREGMMELIQKITSIINM